MTPFLTGPVRSALFVPGNRPERFGKALAAGADCVIVDFEDAVEENQKPQARQNLEAFLLQNQDVRIAVRINAPGHVEQAADIRFCSAHPAVAAIVLPKAETAAQIEALATAGKPVWPLIETARGLLALPEIAASAGVERLTFGALDLAVDLGLREAGEGMQKVFDQVRYSLLVHSVGRALAPPLDTVFADIGNPEGLASAALNARDMGFGGLLCIHPTQVDTVHQIFQPSADEIEWARRVIEAARSGEGAIRLEGRMIDAPVIKKAQRLLQGLQQAD
ncbi:HpcH/HpaI aldolase/citrate lyase family protein [Pseudomonas asuensis]|uniref:CoA ester lyase n=1 Tax=Pseudomonas asuensis TaxID=1825787 RepID=A0ABQ2H2R1_9PSED|nr:CoA ester lyase [Pseudomonas asuensis]GGM29961.1 CoA ester lyase [Pseudomonas asuensis]